MPLQTSKKQHSLDLLKNPRKDTKIFPKRYFSKAQGLENHQKGNKNTLKKTIKHYENSTYLKITRSSQDQEKPSISFNAPASKRLRVASTSSVLARAIASVCEKRSSKRKRPTEATVKMFLPAPSVWGVSWWFLSIKKPPKSTPDGGSRYLVVFW